MKPTMMMNFTVDREHNMIHVEREFAAPLATVWQAWTQADILDQWWAPKPYVARTSHMDFRTGGHWLYAMVGPDGSEQYCRADYDTILPMTQFSYVDAFCDRNGRHDEAFPGMHWTNTFSERGEHAHVAIRIRFDSTEVLEKIIEMGFKEGFTAGMQNLDEVLADGQS